MGDFTQILMDSRMNLVRASKNNKVAENFKETVAERPGWKKVDLR